jgi:hypothetical protein
MQLSTNHGVRDGESITPISALHRKLRHGPLSNVVFETADGLSNTPEKELGGP